MAAMSDSYEYVVAKVLEGSYAVKRTFAFIGYFLFGILLFIAVYASKLFVLFAFAPVVIWMLVFFTWPYFNVEHEYAMIGGNITFSEIFGGRKRKEKFSVRISSFDVIAPYDNDYKHEISAYKATVEFNAFSSDKNPQSPYFALFTDEKGKKCVFFFEATNKALRIMKYYNAATVMTTVSI
jgi:hypothetical protein